MGEHYPLMFSRGRFRARLLPGAVHALDELARGILKAAKGRQDVKDAQAMLRKYSLVFGLTLGSEPPDEQMVDGWNAKKR